MNGGEFKGFDRDTLLLLAENRFNDSKVYYESVKETLKQKAIIPMRQICSDLSEKLFEIDSQMNLVPTKMVSRIRRDTRFAKSKEMYRENLWCMFMRDKHRRDCQPCMWFEFMPGGFSVGVGTFRCEPTYLDFYRKVFRDEPAGFKKALKSALSVDAVADLEQYKRPREGSQDIPKKLQPYYNAKSLYFIYFSSDLEPLFDGSVIDIIRQCVDAYTPMYKFLLKATEKMISEKGNNYE